MDRQQISKTMAYLLRHDPEGMTVDSEGFAGLDDVIKRLEKRDILTDRDELREIVEKDPKGRYEIKGNKIRARYGHSIDVDPTFQEAELDLLYHGTTEEAVEQILTEGLRAMGRQKVHLSRTVKDAKEVGHRHTDDPVLLEVDAAAARKEGITIQRASDRIFVADDIPPEFLKRRNPSDTG